MIMEKSLQEFLGWILILWVVLEYRILLIENKRPQKSDNKFIAKFAIIIFLFVLGGTIFYLKSDVGDIQKNQKLFYWLGIFVLILGVFLRQYSMHIMGRYYVATLQIQKVPKLIVKGPFNILRHPCYAGFIYSLWGIGLVLMNWILLLYIVTFSLIIFLIQINVEEKKLIEFFGSDYTEYQKRTKKIIPFIL